MSSPPEAWTPRNFWFNDSAGLALNFAMVDGVMYRKISGVPLWSYDGGWTFSTTPPPRFDPAAHQAAVDEVRAPQTFEQMVAQGVWVPDLCKDD